MITDFNLLLAETSKAFQVSEEDILGPRRTRAASLARHVVMAIWTDYHSFQDASNRCNRGCHSTSMWARQRILSEAGMDASLASIIDGISKRCQHVPEPIPCFECDSGTMHPICQDYTTTHPKLGGVTIPGIAMLRCDHCQDTLLGEEGNTQIDAYLSEALNPITPAEIQQFLDKYNLSQKQASTITGLGEKNISRWLNGHSRASESISNYLRILLVDSQAFERLKQKNFTGDQNANYPSEERQPDPKEREILKEIDFKILTKYGILEKSQSPKETPKEKVEYFGIYS